MEWMGESLGLIRNFEMQFPFAADDCDTDSAGQIREPSGPLADTR